MGQKVQGSSSFSSTARDVPELVALQGLVAANFEAGQAPELAALQQQALTLWSRKAPKLTALQQASSRAGQAPEFVVLQQQALTLWSLLLQRSKLSCFGACCVAASKLRSRTSSGVCCVALTLRNLVRCRVQLQQASFKAEKLRRSSGAWSLLAFSNKTNKNKIKNKHFT